MRSSEWSGAVHLHPDARRRGRTGPGTGAVPEPPRVAHTIEHLGVTQRDLARLARADGEHACAQQPVSRELDQGGIALAAHDFLVDRARLYGVHRLALELAIALPEGEVAEHRLPRQRIEIVALVEQGARVPEALLHGDAPHPSDPRDLHPPAHLLHSAALGSGG